MKPNLQIECQSPTDLPIIQTYFKTLKEEGEDEHKDGDDQDREDSPTHKAIIIIIALCIGILIVGILIYLIRCLYLRERQRRIIQVRQQSENAFQSQNAQLDQLSLQTQELAQCPICLMPIPTCLLFLTPCHHSFHKACINLWLQVEKNCPSCRTSLNQ